MFKGTFNPLAPFFSAGVQVRNWIYDVELIRPTRLKIPVVSVGNVTMGGTGKTPFMNWLVSEIADLGYKPGLISRSYRTNLPNPEWVHTQPGSFTEFGDEAVFLKLKNPSVSILSGPSKWKSALKMESESSETNVILVDDGFQHRQLHRDFDIVLLDVSVGIKDYEWPPVGRAREKLQSLKRADVIVFTRWEQRNEATMRALEHEIAINALRLKAEQVTDSAQWIAGRSLGEGDTLKSGVGLAFCGLGNPQSFLKSLESQGLRIGKFIQFPDHATYDDAKIKRLIQEGTSFNYLVTSEKDMVKLQEWPFQGAPLCVLPMHLKLSGPLEAFRETLARRLWTNS
jgi:tetraacyldisaccharide 4'-kinase